MTEKYASLGVMQHILMDGYCCWYFVFGYYYYSILFIIISSILIYYYYFWASWASLSILSSTKMTLYYHAFIFYLKKIIMYWNVHAFHKWPSNCHFIHWCYILHLYVRQTVCRAVFWPTNAQVKICTSK